MSLSWRAPNSQTVSERLSSWPTRAIFTAWTAIVAALVVRHVMWRDEVRAYSIATTGDNWTAMLAKLHGDGHPALWYVLLRLAHSLVGRPEVLPAVGLVIALFAVTLIILRSPFSPPLVALIVLSHYFLFEFSVMDRNYGIATLVFFLLALCYRRHWQRGIVLGTLLFVLANTNLIATILVGPFLLFWLLDILGETGFRTSPLLATFTVNAVIAALGILVCALTVLPTYNDAAVRELSGLPSFQAFVRAVLNPAGTAQGQLLPAAVPAGLGSLLLFASTCGLIRRHGAFLGALCGLIAVSLFFSFAVTEAGYRHALMWLSLLIALYWICWDRLEDPAPAAVPAGTMIPAVVRLGCLSFVALLAVQAVEGLRDVKHAATGDLVASRSAEFGKLMSAHPELSRAILIAEPEFLLDTLPYYLHNRTYLLRESRYGNVVRFSRRSRLDLNLSDLLHTGQRLRDRTGDPIVILLSEHLDPTAGAHTHHESYDWTFATSPQQVREFQQKTELLREFGPAKTDESFTAYLLR